MLPSLRPNEMACFNNLLSQEMIGIAVEKE
jgi:hypothetical protein